MTTERTVSLLLYFMGENAFGFVDGMAWHGAAALITCWLDAPYVRAAVYFLHNSLMALGAVAVVTPSR